MDKSMTLRASVAHSKEIFEHAGQFLKDYKFVKKMCDCGAGLKNTGLRVGLIKPEDLKTALFLRFLHSWHI